MTIEQSNAAAPLEGQVAVVTGASRGIGRALAVALGASGARVALVARSEQTLAETAAIIDPKGDRVVVIAADLRDESASELVLERTVGNLGGVDILVNNAGMHYATPLLKTSPQEWRQVFDINLFSVMNLTRVIGGALVENGSGSIINITSSWANKTIPNFSAYTTSKAALNQFTRAIAREWARYGVRVNAIAPGYFATDITRDGMDDPAMFETMLKAVPQRRIGEPREIGPLAVYLASSASDYVTGSIFTIDGGMDLA